MVGPRIRSSGIPRVSNHQKKTRKTRGMNPSRIEKVEGTCPRISVNHFGIMSHDIKHLPGSCQGGNGEQTSEDNCQAAVPAGESPVGPESQHSGGDTSVGSGQWRGALYSPPGTSGEMHISLQYPIFIQQVSCSLPTVDCPLFFQSPLAPVASLSRTLCHLDAIHPSNILLSSSRCCPRVRRSSQRTQHVSAPHTFSATH